MDTTDLRGKVEAAMRKATGSSVEVMWPHERMIADSIVALILSEKAEAWDAAKKSILDFYGLTARGRDFPVNPHREVKP